MHATILSTLLVLAAAAANVSAHGYLSSPPPRGIEKVGYQIDDLKSPNRGGKICRGEPEGKVTDIGHSITLGFTITAPHTGPCEVYILDKDLGNPIKIASKYDCAAPGKVGPWTIAIPSNISGRRVLRWYWEGRHVTPGEPYEQCIDLNISGGGGDAPTAPTTPTAPADNRNESAGGSAPTAPPAPSSPPPPPPPPPTPTGSAPSGADTPSAPDSGSYTPSPPGDGGDSPTAADNVPDDDGSDGKSPATGEAPKDGGESPATDTAPDSGPAPDSSPAPPPAQDSPKDCGCKPGTFTCKGNRLGQCNQGKWSFIHCPSSLKCVLKSPVDARCDWPSSKSNSAY